MMTSTSIKSYGYQVSPKLSLEADQAAYSGSATIVVSGAITQVMGDDVSIVITNPAGTPIASRDVPTDEFSGMYRTEFVAGGPGWAANGTYAITASWEFCPEFVSNRTSFQYSSVADSLSKAVSPTIASVTTSTQCSDAQPGNQTSTSFTSAGSATGAGLQSYLIPLAVLVTSLIFVFALVARRFARTRMARVETERQRLKLRNMKK